MISITYLKSGITYIASRSVPHPPIKKKSGCAPRCRTPRVAAQTTKDLHHNKTLQNNKYTLTERFEPTSQVT